MSAINFDVGVKTIRDQRTSRQRAEIVIQLHRKEPIDNFSIQRGILPDCRKKSLVTSDWVQCYQTPK